VKIFSKALTSQRTPKKAFAGISLTQSRQDAKNGF
jgi:hypothetical protein